MALKIKLKNLFIYINVLIIRQNFVYINLLILFNAVLS